MTETSCADLETMQDLKDMANQLRIDSIHATTASESGHPTSCASAAEIMSVLFFHTMRYSIEFPKDPASDRFILSKGHAAPVLYAAWSRAGLFPIEELMNYRKIDSDFEGHPTPRLNFIDVATGSLGQGLGIAAGMAYTGKYVDKSDYRVYCLLGDGESTEGSVWEALSFASHYKLDNLVAIFDVNRQGQLGASMLQHEMSVYEERMKAFGWNTYVVDGHNVEELCKTLHLATTIADKPTCILAKTYKGKGCPGFEDLENWHGKALGNKSEQCIKTIRSKMSSLKPLKLKPRSITANVQDVDLCNMKLSRPPAYKIGQMVQIRSAYASGIVKLGEANSRILVLDCDTSNSTYGDRFKAAYPDRFLQCYIAEQNTVSVGMGCSCRHRNVVFCNGFGAFFTRAFDQIRMGAISQTNINIAGSHGGLSISSDGSPQMALEDIAMFRAIPGSTVFYPSDAVSTERAVELAANTEGICYIRTSRLDVPVIYSANEVFETGKAKVVRKSNNDQVTVIGCCATLYEAMQAADELSKEDINIRLIDPFTLKPFDADTVVANARETGGRIITVEEHYAWGGLGDTVAGALSEERNICIKKLAVRDVPRSGKASELLEMYGISAKHIVKAVQSILE